MWLTVARSNNKRAITVSFFIECVREFNGCPVKVRSGCNTENGVIATIQCEFRGTREARMFGTSPANQRIEEWWWIDYFKDLVEKELFHPGNELQEEALWYCFSTILQRDLDKNKRALECPSFTWHTRYMHTWETRRVIQFARKSWRHWWVASHSFWWKVPICNSNWK